MDLHRRRQTDPLDYFRRAQVCNEINNFRLFRDLRKTDLEPRRKVSLRETIQAEKSILRFNERRKSEPDQTLYKELYSSLSQSLPSYNVTPRDTRQLMWK